MILSTTKSATTTFLLSSSFAILLVLLLYSEYQQLITTWSSSSCCCFLLIIGLSTLGFMLVVMIAARATMIAWITVLVMLAVAGNRRRVLVRRGRLITTDVAVYLFRVVIKERGLVAVACAALLSLSTAMLGLTL